MPLKSKTPATKLTKTSIPTSDKEAGKGGVMVKDPNRPLHKSDGAESTSRSRGGSVHNRYFKEQVNEKRKRGKEATSPINQIKVIRTDRSDDDHSSRYNQRRGSFNDFG